MSQEEIDVLLKVEDRDIILPMRNGATIHDLRAAFSTLSEEDKAIGCRLKIFQPTFKVFNEKFKIEAEVKSTHRFKDAEVVHVGWTPYNLEMVILFHYF